MKPAIQAAGVSFSEVVFAFGERPLFAPGDTVKVMTRSPIGHYRVPMYLRGHTGIVEGVVEPAQLDNEREGFGANAGGKRHYYRVAFPLGKLWQNYQGPSHDTLYIEIYETWLERS